jgi:GNAT superfamily N-acetyltransferase
MSETPPAASHTATPVGITVRAFAPADQTVARALILEGLAAHFGFLDETMNRDLDDIAATFAGDAFFVATIDGAIAGTGGFHQQPDGTAQIVRMSTAATHRRRGVGRALAAGLIDEARARGCRRVTLATNADWDDAVAFYGACGFEEVVRTETGVVFAMKL